MPLTASGKKALRNFIRQYGEVKGREYFYRTAKKYNKKEWFASKSAKKKHT